MLRQINNAALLISNCVSDVRGSELVMQIALTAGCDVFVYTSQPRTHLALWGDPLDLPVKSVSELPDWEDYRDNERAIDFLQLNSPANNTSVILILLLKTEIHCFHCFFSTPAQNDINFTLLGQTPPFFCFCGKTGTPPHSSIPNLSFVQGGPCHIVVNTK